jgi:hypothetical protein
MRADNSACLTASARHRHELTRAKAIRALRELDRAGTPVTFEQVARTAGISRSWLYSQDDIRIQIQQLRDQGRRTPASAIPASQRASDTSLAKRLSIAAGRVRQLEQENSQLRRQLAEALGQIRQNRGLTLR